MKLEQAQEIAERIKRYLAPNCDRIEIAGSVRRRKPDVGDIEIVCIPSMVQPADLFGGQPTERSPSFAVAVERLGDVVKGSPVFGKYIKVDLGTIMLDLFTATADNWGLIYAIRTGSAAFSHEVLATGWVRNGYKSVDGMLTHCGKQIPTPEEADLFRLAGVKWIEPELRNVQVAP